ncbi:MAG: hypothetical protein KKE20_02535 [Nanoarchaeota archaeon]|nr:hypothetical protein [Nanoarchaeota archaeon]
MKNNRIWLIYVFLLLLLVPSSLAGSKTKGVEGYVELPNGSIAYNATVVVHLITDDSTPCTTFPAVQTDSSGYFITNLANLRKDSDGVTDCGDDWHLGDDVWADADGSTVVPIPFSRGNSTVSQVPSESGATFRLSNASLQNTPPEISSVSAAPAVMSGGNTTKITATGQTDLNRDNISLVCAVDTTNTITPTLANNVCGGNWRNITYPYSTELNCTYTGPTGVDDVYYARCRLFDYQNYSSPIRSTSFIIDDTGPQTYDNYGNNNTWVNSDQTITITPDCGSTACNWTYYCNTSDLCTPSINYSSPVTFSLENLSYLRYHSEDLFYRTQDIVSYIINIDKGAPIIENASVTIENGSIFTNSTTIKFNWSGFADNLSGINGYYYSFSNNQGTASGTYDASSPGQLSGSHQGNISVFVWAVDNAGNIGLSVDDSITVDSESPSIGNVVSNTVNQTSTLNITVNATINDSVTGINRTPTVEYRYGNGAWTGPLNMTLVAGNESYSNYTFNIPPPGTDWVAYRGQLIYWNITAVDDLGNTREIQYNTTVVSINLLTFHVRDRILNISLDGVTITGNGTQCTGGCTLNETYNISELNGGYSFSITKPGFSSNTTKVNVNSQDYIFDIYLDDTQAPTVSFLNYSLYTYNATYYAKIYASITDNLNLDAKRLSYTISQYFSESGTVNMTYVDGNTYLAQIGPYNDSAFISSQIIANDSYSLTRTLTLDDVWYVFVNGSSATYNTGDDELVLSAGWNLISIPFLNNHSVNKVLEQLSNGNWGCGRDGIIPVQCNESAGDYIGNFTKIMSYNTTSSSWETFNPTDQYLAMSNQEIKTLDPKRGYWIKMTAAQDLILDLKFD